MKPRTAVTLLYKNRKYLKKICISGYNNEFQAIKNWLSDIGYSDISTIIEDINTDSHVGLPGIYNLNGQKLETAPDSGIYIENGVKKIATKK